MLPRQPFRIWWDVRFGYIERGRVVVKVLDAEGFWYSPRFPGYLEKAGGHVRIHWGVTTAREWLRQRLADTPVTGLSS